MRIQVSKTSEGTHFRDVQNGAERVEDRTAVRWGRCAVSLSISAAHRPPGSGREGAEGKWWQEEADLPKLFSPFDCVRHFELEKRLSFVLFQIIRGNRIGDSEYKEDPFDPTLPKVTLHTPSPWSTRRQTVSTLGDEATVLRAFLRAPADPAPLGHKG